MSKPEREKIVIPVEEDVFLSNVTMKVFADSKKELTIPQILAEFTKAETAKINASNKEFELKRALAAAVECVDADTIVYEDAKVTLVRPEPTRQFDLQKMINNLAIMGKLKQEVIDRIVEASYVPVPAKEQYVKVTLPKGTLPKKLKGGSDE